VPGKGKFHVKPSTLHQSASATHDRADQMGSMARPSGLSGSAYGAVGESAAGSMNRLTGQISDHIGTFSRGLHSQADNLSSTAANYEGTETGIRDNLRGIGNHPTAPPRTVPGAGGQPYYQVTPGGKHQRIGWPQPSPTGQANTTPVGLNHPELNTGQPRPNTVFRVDDRPPNVMMQNGFSAHGNDYNLWQHQTGGQFLEHTGYISTTSDASATNQFLKPIPGKPFIQHNGTTYGYKEGWEYHIQPTGNMVYLPDQHMTGNLQDSFAHQQEWAAVQQISPQNVVGAKWNSGYFSLDGKQNPHPDNGPGVYLPNPNHVPGHSGYDPATDPNSQWHGGIPNITQKPPGLDESSGDSDSEYDSDASGSSQGSRR
jgi:hypothetical protein